MPEKPRRKRSTRPKAAKTRSKAVPKTEAAAKRPATPTPKTGTEAGKPVEATPRPATPAPAATPKTGTEAGKPVEPTPRPATAAPATTATPKPLTTSQFPCVCPGEKYPITRAVCMGRQERNYDKCLRCGFAVRERRPRRSDFREE